MVVLVAFTNALHSFDTEVGTHLSIRWGIYYPSECQMGPEIPSDVQIGKKRSYLEIWGATFLAMGAEGGASFMSALSV